MVLYFEKFACGSGCWKGAGERRLFEPGSKVVVSGMDGSQIFEARDCGHISCFPELTWLCWWNFLHSPSVFHG